MKNTVLLTGFRPFDDRGINGAETVVRALHGEIIDRCRVESRLINVVWSDVSRFCERSIPKLKSRFILSLGEADRPWPTFETTGYFQAEGDDVAGVAPPMCGQSDARKSKLQFDPTWFKGLEHPPKLSDDAGAYLCNWMLYNGVGQASVPLGFLHLPVQGTIASEVYLERFVPVVRRLIEKNL